MFTATSTCFTFVSAPSGYRNAPLPSFKWVNISVAAACTSVG